MLKPRLTSGFFIGCDIIMTNKGVYMNNEFDGMKSEEDWGVCDSMPDLISNGSTGGISPYWDV